MTIHTAPPLPIAVRTALDATPVPMEAGAPVSASLIDEAGGWRLAWCFDGGRRKEAFGPVYVSVRMASAACHRLNERGAG